MKKKYYKDYYQESNTHWIKLIKPVQNEKYFKFTTLDCLKILGVVLALFLLLLFFTGVPA